MATTPEQPQIYLITPPEFELSTFPAQLAAVLDAHEVACVRLALATLEEDRVARAADAVREVTTARDIALTIADHVQLAERFALDGVHLTDGARSVRKARKALGDDAIVGAFCGNSRHDGMTAGEIGADYIAFGPTTETALGTGEPATPELFAWWSEMIELPVVAEGNLTPDAIATLSPITDFFGIGPEIWGTDTPAAALATLKSAMT
ncbi:thiamine-phosphate pyrophosphorylase [Actibacterium mucosum KCTC 23349]|uniref:Thiamine-phosphate pyrophosphorylase n=1 Tax=Actibacterium mucosum KCTC 23349 TaxID=1454373 RepID=A0A037ZM52_9RHOB|nr:thiamine phosphate synthase [Actibacterium mucosum]KAJ56724.1 thiamine-phosphate pyrophosphorylase [Actibacterium mucosum KCTC 23349]